MSKGSGALPGYEVTYITRAEMADEALTRFKEKVRTIVKEFGGDTILEEDWGSRKFAYTVGKETRGRYTHAVFTGKPGIVAELERNFRMQEHVLRFLSVRVAEEFDAPKYQEGRFDFNKKMAEVVERTDRWGDRGDRGDRWGDRGDRWGGDRGDRGDRGGYGGGGGGDRGDRGGYGGGGGGGGERGPRSRGPRGEGGSRGPGSF